jgi:enoyl-CoA hydratase
MGYECILLEVRDRVARITFNRPHLLNAFSEAMSKELIRAVAECVENDEVRVIVLTGAGKAFMAGADISMLEAWTALPGGKADLEKVLAGFFSPTMLEQCPTPVLAAVNGPALGMGCEIAIGCDLRIAARSAVFGQPEIDLGIMTGAGATQRLRRIVGAGRAMEMLLTGRRLSAEEAWGWGLVNRVVADADLESAVADLAREISRKPKESLRSTKRAVVQGYSTGLSEGVAYELGLFARIFETADAREGIRAFLEKRKPSFL